MGKAKARKSQIKNIITVEAIAHALKNIDKGPIFPFNNETLEGKIKNSFSFLKGIKCTTKNIGYARYLITKYKLLENKDLNIKSEIDIKDEPFSSYNEFHCNEDDLDLNSEQSSGSCNEMSNLVIPFGSNSFKTEVDVTEVKTVYFPEKIHFKHEVKNEEYHEESLENADEESNEECVVPAITKKIQSSKAKKKRSCLKSKQEQLLDLAQPLLSTKEDKWEVIGKSIGLQLNDLNTHQQIIAQKLISDVIYLGRMKKLTEESCINLSPFTPMASTSPAPTSNK